MRCVRIGYFNVGFDLFIKTEDDRFIVGYLITQIEKGKLFEMRDLAKWCVMHNIEYKTFFKYRKDYPMTANIWNLYSYARFKVSKNRIV